MSRSRKIATTIVLVTVAWLSASACSLADGACLRMSDCDDGLSCVEGTCVAPRRATAAAVLAPADASAE